MVLRHRHEASSVETLLESIFSSNGKKHILLSHVAQHWQKIVGNVLSKRSRPFAIEGTLLCIRAESPAAAQRLSMMGATIAQKVSKEWDLPVSGVKVVIGKISARRIPKTTGKKQVLITPRADEISKNLERLKDRIDDPDIAISLATLMATWNRRFGK
ncbi:MULTISPECIES: DUF721 domain-containing protein [Aminobacterium]|uniref:DUF721 domain-containing protein n=1 Tax=Aminobacterium TaxID=81466 RepID=UPI001695DA75|nr:MULTISPECIES: DUF721 domain-containing protein [unclassified Aminobacterium]MDD2378998.1 DUF721 domain-containing protein [Aminobacterium colombiense]MDD3768510.1 DUF721 domain-containing protein [Aminobacterium colombiense]MDD4266135.1 DUF721 domain-containing protein [Aminobacterium colombiense]MDD4585829.1 DUF721 domain-containing protein [Aminobacterium colombiense]NLK30015.1 DUF721 domain-containing protein [Aminobacterium colombiense]